MRFQRIPCLSNCKQQNSPVTMIIINGKRGPYYFCPSCKRTLNIGPNPEKCKYVPSVVRLGNASKAC